MWPSIVVGVLVAGALAGPRTFLHNIALSLDVLAQSLGWNRVLCITISSRAGLAARCGRGFWSRVICLLFLNPKHCDEAIQADITRSLDSLNLLFDGEPKAVAAIAYLRQLQ